MVHFTQQYIELAKVYQINSLYNLIKVPKGEVISLLF